MKTEIDQAHFLIGAAMPGSGATAAKVAGDLLRRSREQNREKIKEEQVLLFDDLYD